MWLVVNLSDLVGQLRLKYAPRKNSQSHVCAYKWKLIVGDLEHIQSENKTTYTFEIDSVLEAANMLARRMNLAQDVEEL